MLRFGRSHVRRFLLGAAALLVAARWLAPKAPWRWTRGWGRAPTPASRGTVSGSASAGRPPAAGNGSCPLRAYGRGAGVQKVRSAEKPSDGARVEYRRGALTEWYVNVGPAIEQGFTLERAAGGRAESSRSTSSSAPTSRRRSPPTRAACAFATSEGARLRYSDLAAFDAQRPVAPRPLRARRRPADPRGRRPRRDLSADDRPAGLHGGQAGRLRRRRRTTATARRWPSTSTPRWWARPTTTIRSWATAPARSTSTCERRGLGAPAEAHRARHGGRTTTSASRSRSPARPSWSARRATTTPSPAPTPAPPTSSGARTASGASSGKLLAPDLAASDQFGCVGRGVRRHRARRRALGGQRRRRLGLRLRLRVRPGRRPRLPVFQAELNASDAAAGDFFGAAVAHGRGDRRRRRLRQRRRGRPVRLRLRLRPRRHGLDRAAEADGLGRQRRTTSSAARSASAATRSWSARPSTTTRTTTPARPTCSSATTRAGSRATRSTPRTPANNDHFGTSVAISSDAILVGAPDDTGSQGEAFVFARLGDALAARCCASARRTATTETTSEPPSRSAAARWPSARPSTTT